MKLLVFLGFALVMIFGVYLWGRMPKPASVDDIPQGCLTSVVIAIGALGMLIVVIIGALT